MPGSTNVGAAGVRGFRTVFAATTLALAVWLPSAIAQTAPARNRLAGEATPYLLSLADDPVNWLPWGPEAFDRAKAEDKPIFLSIGYPSCRWCRVMRRESFQDPAIAKLLNDGFVCVKVDREERPDVDRIYMAALEAFGSGGWPMSMFLLPDGRPFYGGTYFPPRDKSGFAGMTTLLAGIAKSWREERPEIERAAGGLVEIVRRKLEGTPPRRGAAPLDPELAAVGLARLSRQFDPEYGGFGYNPENPRLPKFPDPVNLAFLLDLRERDQRRLGDEPPETERGDPLEMVLLTLDQMARGGIRDQFGGGYHRVAASRFWVVPHFEKMLCDNALLASVHARAFERTGDPRWRAEAEATFDFVDRELTAPSGGFYSSLDAENQDGEGAYYVWTRGDVVQALQGAPEADLDAFLQVHGFKREPNFGGDRYVPLQPRSRAEQAEPLGMSVDELERRIAPLRARLLAARATRPAPSRDDKILTAWNGLMIAAYAEGHRVLKDERRLKAAEKAADFALGTLREPSGRLLRTQRAGRAGPPAFLEDYAYLVHGLLKLHEATNDPQRLQQARELTDRMIDDFADERDGGFFFTADDHEPLLARPKDPLDGALPNANAVAVLNLLAIHRATGEDRYLDLAGKTLDAFADPMLRNPASMPTMLTALLEYRDLRPLEPTIGSQPSSDGGPP